MLAQDRDEVGMSISLMQKHGLARACRKFELLAKRGALCVMRRKIAEVIKTALADRDNLGSLCKGVERAGAVGRPFLRQVRMQARGRKQLTRMRLRERHRRFAARDTRARDDHLHNARRGCAREYQVTVSIEAVVSKIKSDVDQRGRGRGDGAVPCGMVYHA